MDELYAGIVQFDVSLGQVERNRSHVIKGLERLAQEKVNFAVLPEMWSSGFHYSKMKEHAEKTPGLLEELCGLARDFGMFIMGTLPESADNGVYNTFYAVDSIGRICSKYRKIHLFLPSGEGRFLPGSSPVVLDTKWGRVGFLTCYDIRFPELARALALSGATIFAVSAQWPERRAAHWDVLLRARAIENQAFVIAANRCGRDPSIVYGGNSQIISPWGDVIGKCGKSEQVLNRTVDLSLVEDFRSLIPCLDHRIPEAYEVKNN